MPKLRGPDLNELSPGTWYRHGQAVLLQAVDMKLDSLADELEQLLASLAYRHTARKSGTWAPQLVSPRSMTTMYRITAILISPS